MCETWEKEMSLYVTFSTVCINSFILQTFSPQLDLREIFKCKKIKELTERIIRYSSLYTPYLDTFVQSHTFQQNTHTYTHANNKTRSLLNVCKLYAKFHSENVIVDHILQDSNHVSFKQWIDPEQKYYHFEEH